MRFWIIMAIIIAVPFVGGQLSIGNPEEQVDRGLFIDIPAPEVDTNGSIIFTLVNMSEWWITNEGNMDNVEDLLPHLQGLNLSTADIWVNETGDTMTGQLIVKAGNGNIVTSNSAGSIDVRTSSDEAGSISFGNTADIGISRDGVSATYNYNGAFIFKQKTSKPVEDGEFIFIEQAGDWRFALPKATINLGTYNPRSFIIAGPSVNNGSNFDCRYWGFNNLPCDTSGQGADLGVQNNLEVLDTIYGNIINSSTEIYLNNATPISQNLYNYTQVPTPNNSSLLSINNITNLNNIQENIVVTGNNNITTGDRVCLNSACTSYIFTNASHSIWK